MDQQKVTIETRDSSGDEPIHLLYHPELCWYFDDVERVREYLLRKGYEISYRQSADLWESYSAWMMASWLIISDEGLEEFFQWLQEKSNLNNGNDPVG